MILVADNLQILAPEIVRAVAEKDPEPVARLAAACAASGAQALDVNSGPLSRDPEGGMRFLVQAARQGFCLPLPLWLDTSNPRAMAAGLAECGGKAVMNGVSLEPARLSAMLPLAREHGADLVGYLLSEDGQVPPDAAGRLENAARLAEAADRDGVDPARLIFDPVVPPLSWNDGPRQAGQVLETIRLLPDLLGFPARTVAGLSNLTSGPGPRHRKRVFENAYLAMLAASGLTHLLFNVFHESAMVTARACNALTGGGVFCWEG
ncbi:MAG: dihydropteroate synthase [Proteobacteria bacterium]|nr:dihydropteroate synthase [Pseudomonadota bacterium]